MHGYLVNTQDRYKACNGGAVMLLHASINSCSSVCAVCLQNSRCRSYRCWWT